MRKKNEALRREYSVYSVHRPYFLLSLPYLIFAVLIIGIFQSDIGIEGGLFEVLVLSGRRGSDNHNEFKRPPLWRCKTYSTG